MNAPLDPQWVTWVETTLGGKLTGAARTPTGGSRETWFVQVQVGEEQLDAVLRLEAGGSFTGSPINVGREAQVYRALEATAVPAPRVLGVADGDAAVLLERLGGSSDLPDDPAEREATLLDFVDVIAELHQVDVDALDLPGLARPTTPEDHARLDLRMWQDLEATAGDVVDPLVAYAGGYLLAHPPTKVHRTCLVQGDTGPGNFMAEGGKVTGLVDMEFAHVGDPLDDIAWMLDRGFSRLDLDPGPYLARYSHRSGIPIDAASLAYYAVAVPYRCAVTTSLAVARGGGARGWAPYLLVTQRYLLSIGATLAELVGRTEPAVELPDLPPTPFTAWYDHLLDGIRDGVRAIADPDAREALRNQQILVHRLRAEDRSGAAVARLEAEDRQASGIDAADDEALRVLAREAGTDGDQQVLAYLQRRLQRQRRLWSTLLDRPRR